MCCYMLKQNFAALSTPVWQPSSMADDFATSILPAVTHRVTRRRGVPKNTICKHITETHNRRNGIWSTNNVINNCNLYIQCQEVGLCLSLIHQNSTRQTDTSFVVPVLAVKRRVQLLSIWIFTDYFLTKRSVVFVIGFTCKYFLWQKCHNLPTIRAFWVLGQTNEKQVYLST